MNETTIESLINLIWTGEKMLNIIVFIILLLIPFDINALESNMIFFQEGVIKAIGVSAEGQNKFEAITSAEIIAQRNLVEKIKGVTISSVTHMENATIISDTIHARVQGMIIGAVSCGKKYYENKGYAEVCLQIPLHGRGGVFDVVYPEIQKSKPKISSYQFNRTIRQSESKFFDGLILDVRGHKSFQPALINRILDNYGRIVYGPSMISHQLMIDKGPVQFATTRGKAEAILTGFGVKHPLFIKSFDIRSYTDVVVSDVDAEKVFVSNEKSRMLHKACVVFILK